MPTGIYKRTEFHKKRISNGLMGHTVSLETRSKISSNHARQWLGKSDEETANWKGDKVGYGALHDWIRKTLGSPLRCSWCDKMGGTTRNYHWANLDKRYRRNIDDWVRLCVSCHKLHDLGRLTKR